MAIINCNQRWMRIITQGKGEAGAWLSSVLMDGEVISWSLMTEFFSSQHTGFNPRGEKKKGMATLLLISPQIFMWFQPGPCPSAWLCFCCSYLRHILWVWGQYGHQSESWSQTSAPLHAGRWSITVGCQKEGPQKSPNPLLNVGMRPWRLSDVIQQMGPGHKVKLPPQGQRKTALRFVRVTALLNLIENWYLLSLFSWETSSGVQCSPGINCHGVRMHKIRKGTGCGMICVGLKISCGSPKL